MYGTFQFLAGSFDELNFGVWIAAVVVAVALALAGFVWKIIISNLGRFLYRIPVAGRWTTQIEKNSAMADHEWAQLFQFGSRVWGQTESNDSHRRRYKVRGLIVGEKLCMTYREVTKPYLDAGAILLQIGSNGNVMEGYEISVSFTTKQIAAQRYNWKSAGQ